MIAVYTRVSTRQQDTAAQRAELQRWAGDKPDVRWFEDGGYTGSNTDRPEFQRMMQEIRAGNIESVAVYKLDRLTRSLADLALLMREFSERGVAFVCVTQNFDTSTPAGRLTMNVLASCAQFEREMICERVTDGVRAAIARGQRWGFGNPKHRKHLPLDVEEVRRLRADGLTHREIGERLGCSARTVARHSKKQIMRTHSISGDVPQTP